MTYREDKEENEWHVSGLGGGEVGRGGGEGGREKGKGIEG